MKPDPVLGAPTEDGGVREIGEMWRERWLRPRIEREGLLDRIAGSVRGDILVGNAISSEPSTALHGIDIPTGALPLRPRTTGRSAHRIHRAAVSPANCYADRLCPEELEHIDVDLGLGDHLHRWPRRVGRSS